MARLSKTAYWPWPKPPGPPPLSYQWLRRYTEEENCALEKLIERSNALTGEEVVGALLGFSVEDTTVFYVVTRERPLTLSWVPMGSRQADPALIRGLHKEDVLARRHRCQPVRHLRIEEEKK